jgi:hypothetical protein
VGVIRYRDVKDLRVLANDDDDTQIQIVIEHAEEVLKIERRKLPSSGDFDLVRGAITSGFDDVRRPTNSG